MAERKTPGKPEYFVGVDLASEFKAEPVRVSLTDTIICEQRVKEKIEEALKDAAEKKAFPPGVQEITIPIKVMTVPGLDANEAYIIDPAALPRLTAPKKHAPFYFHHMLGIGVANKAAINNIGPKWRPLVRAEMNERCETCENSLVCKTEEVCPTVCAGCRKRFFMYNDCEVETHQICLGFDWEKAKKDFQCDACANKVLRV